MGKWILLLLFLGNDIHVQRIITLNLHELVVDWGADLNSEQTTHLGV